MPSQEDLELDRRLLALARCYAEQAPPAGAMERLLGNFAEHQRGLSDEQLDWLAAAGPGFRPPPRD